MAGGSSSTDRINPIPRPWPGYGIARVPQWNIAVGNFFFKYRNAVFPLLFALAVVVWRPRILFAHPTLDHALAVCGALTALLGQGVRLATIGYEYIERGGKAGKVYASHLVQGGVYAMTRNPMYVGNGLIAIGITLVAGAPVIYLVVLPFFLFVYHAIIAAEEVYLRRQFGAAYDEYCARVNRFLPALGRIPQVLAGVPYDWKRAIRKELSTLTGLLLGLILLPVWRRLWLEGWASVSATLPRTIVWVLGVLSLYGIAVYLKHHRKVFY